MAINCPNYLRGGPRIEKPLAIVRSIAGMGEGCRPYNENLEEFGGSWLPSHGIWDQPPFTDDEDVFSSPKRVNGSTWVKGTNPANCGLLVVDMLKPRRIGMFSAFQMYSDGKCTHMEIFAHPRLSEPCPQPTDPEWYSVGAEQVMNHPLEDDLPEQAVSPAHKWTVTPFTSRYLRINARNDGRYGDGYYIEFKGLKAFRPRPSGVPMRASTRIDYAYVLTVNSNLLRCCDPPYPCSLAVIGGSEGAVATSPDIVQRDADAFLPCSALCDAGATLDDECNWTGNGGTAWENAPGATGHMVVDLQMVRQLQHFTVFQASPPCSSGAVTSVCIQAAVSLSDLVPNVNSWGWQRAHEPVAMPAGAPFVQFSLHEPIRVRWLRIDVQNDGSFGSSEFIVLRGIKAFQPGKCSLEGRLVVGLPHIEVPDE
eukprot:TRINITY_DN8573_c0_g1_i1.p1 TRINITY_DN8573_c0_g1~~TRINITY_DN8573_c0_g1_i1.p1  ORF type:complete len:468 (-),score=51.35 TRINITY_DN8573_c0_g1_i1:56-1327(-)